jgi:hypothetical protein
MNELVDYFKNSGMKLGVFYPTHHLIAVFRHPADAQFAVHQIWNAGFATSDAIAADGKDVLEFDKEETSLAGFVMQALSRFFATEQEFADHDMEDARHGAGFLAVRCPTDELKNAAWSIIEPEKPLDAVCGSRGGVPRVARTGKQVVKGGVGRSGAL